MTSPLTRPRGQLRMYNVDSMCSTVPMRVAALRSTMRRAPLIRPRNIVKDLGALAADLVRSWCERRRDVFFRKLLL